METRRIPIDGMTCTSCAARITKALRRVDGATSVRVDLASDSATVTYDPARTSLPAIASAVAAVGYEARTEAAELLGPAAPRGLLRRFGLRGRPDRQA